MTLQEVFDAVVLGEPVVYQGERWTIHSTFDDDTADLVRKIKTGDLITVNAPFAQMKLAGGLKNAM